MKYLKNIISLTLILLSTIVMAQTGTIKGIIKTSDGKEAESVSVGLKGTDKGGFTNRSGEYEIKNIVPGTYTLVTSYVGLEKTEQQVEVKAGETTMVPEITLKENAQQLNEVNIYADRINRYNDTLTEVSTRIPTRLLDAPQSIQVIPQEIIKDQKLFNVAEAVKNIAGVNTSSPSSDLTMRGFNSGENNYAYNGIRGSIFNFNQQVPLYNVERMESIKGPASALFSNGQPGGIINIVTKKPQLTPDYNLEFNYGSWNQYRVVADATGPLTKNKKLLYRLVAGYENAESFRNFYETKNGQITAGLTYLFSAKTSLNFEYGYQWDNNTAAYDRGTYVLYGADGKPDFTKTDRSFATTSPVDFGKNASHNIQLDFRHKFNEHVSVTVLALADRLSLDMQEHQPGYGSNGINATNDSTVGRSYDKYISRDEHNTVTAFTNIKVNTGKIKHNILIGGDVVNYVNPKNYYLYSSVVPNLSLKNPDYSFDIPSSYVPDFIEDDKLHSTIIGAYIQDQLEIIPQVKALLSLRYDSYKTKRDPASDQNYTQDVISNDAKNLAPRFGLVYEPLNYISFYASYCESFNPQYSFNALEGGPFDPEKGIQYEAGAKGQFLNNKLSASIAFYTIDKTNILVNDPTDSNNVRLMPINGVTSKGVEVTVQGNITSDFSIIANLALNNAEVTKTSTIGEKGDRLTAAPKTISSAWLNYKFSKGAIRGLGIGAGVYYRSNTVGSFSDQTFIIPAYSTLDAGINYKIKKMSFGLNVNNILDEIYFIGSYGNGAMFPGAPRNIRASVGISF